MGLNSQNGLIRNGHFGVDYTRNSISIKLSLIGNYFLKFSFFFMFSVPDSVHFYTFTKKSWSNLGLCIWEAKGINAFNPVMSTLDMFLVVARNQSIEASGYCTRIWGTKAAKNAIRGAKVSLTQMIILVSNRWIMQSKFLNITRQI